MMYLLELFANFTLVTFKRLSANEVNNYEEWLGPVDQQNKDDETNRIPKRGTGPASTVICNHFSWVETLGLILSPLHPGFTPRAETAKAPLIGTGSIGLESLFIDRGADEAGRQRIVEQIKQRQTEIEVDGVNFNPIMIFAEGTTTNGQYLLKFKRGAFIGMRTVQPVFAKITERMFMPMYDVLPFFPMLVLWYSSFCVYHLQFTIMPEFSPTVWMLENHKGKSETGQDWEIFAECAREAMARYSGLLPVNPSLKDKVAYEAFMNMEKPSVTIDGQTFTYDRNNVGSSQRLSLEKSKVKEMEI